jgi:hypothetical protein
MKGRQARDPLDMLTFLEHVYLSAVMSHRVFHVQLASDSVYIIPFGYKCDVFSLMGAGSLTFRG